jgi:hypothetical protein
MNAMNAYCYELYAMRRMLPLELVTETKRSGETLIGFRDYHNGMKFTTFDNKNDENPTINCALKWGAGWWFKNCFQFCPTCSNASYFDSRNNLLSFNYIKMMIK